MEGANMKKILFALALSIVTAGFAAEDIRIDLAANKWEENALLPFAE